MVTHQKEVYYIHGIWQLHITHKTSTRRQLPWMVNGHLPCLGGFPPTQGGSLTNPRMITHQKELYFRLGIWHLDFTHKTKRRVTHQPKDGHPPEGSVLQTWNLALRLNSQNKSQMTTSMDGHLPSLGGSPTNPRMIDHPPT